MNIHIPKAAAYILEVLNGKGHEAYVVGGCVRDCILGKTPQDWDITTSAKPEQLKQLFSHTYDTGIQHGTVTVLLGRESFEVTTYRIEGEYKDFRRPSQVFFTDSLKADLSRRDFTINAIAYHPMEGFMDPFGGKQDIEKRIIRGVGNPELRFQEDALRMLRAIRFSGQLDFEIDPCTWEALKKCAKLIQYVSGERIRDELNKLLIADHPEKFILLHASKILSFILPEFAVCMDTEQNHPYHIYTVGVHSLKAVEYISRDIILRWTMLLHDIGKPFVKTIDGEGTHHFYGHIEKGVDIAQNVLKRLKFDNQTSANILVLIQWHDEAIEATAETVRKTLSILGKTQFLQLLEVKKADLKAKGEGYIEKGLKELQELQNMYEQVIESGDCITMRDLAISGADLIQAGFKQGKHLGSVLNRLFEIVLEDPGKNNREYLLYTAKHFSETKLEEGFY